MEKVLLCGRAGREFGERLASALGIACVASKVRTFADGEMEVTLGGQVKGARVLLVQTFGAPVQDALMELLLLADAARRSGAEEICAVVPYLGYSRQDRAPRPGAAVSAEVVAKMLEAAGIDRMVTVDVHSSRVAGAYGIPFESVSAMEVLAARIGKKLAGARICVVSPDAGGMPRAELVTDILRRQGAEAAVVMVEKRREEANVVASARLLGNVEGCACVLVDDMIDTAGTLCAAAQVVREGGASSVSAAVVHGLFNGPAVEKLMGLGLDALWVCDTLPLREEVRALTALEVVEVAGVVKRVIRD